MKIIIAGGRDFNNYALLCKKCDIFFSLQTEIEIVSGVAKGADSLGEKYAKEKGYPIKQFHAEWDKYKKGAGYKRNEEMAKYADGLVAFWDGKSKGTKHMIDLAKKYNLKVRVVKMTVREKLENILVKYGMFQEQAHKVLNISIPKIDELSDEYQVLWDSECEVYGDEMYNFLFEIIKKEALEWIDNNVPKIWFRENFVD